MKVRVLDWITHSPCEGSGCGCNQWVIDGDGYGRFWLLCADTKRIGCCNTKELPPMYEVVK